MKATTRRAIQAGKISLYDKIMFTHKADAVNCFGRDIQVLQQGGTETGRGDFWVWFPDLDSTDWDNKLVGMNTIYERKKGCPVDADNHLQGQLIANKTHHVFLKKKIGNKTGYMYHGTFSLDRDQSRLENRAVWVRVSSDAACYGIGL